MIHHGFLNWGVSSVGLAGGAHSGSACRTSSWSRGASCIVRRVEACRSCRREVERGDSANAKPWRTSRYALLNVVHVVVRLLHGWTARIGWDPVESESNTSRTTVTRMVGWGLDRNDRVKIRDVMADVQSERKHDEDDDDDAQGVTKMLMMTLKLDEDGDYDAQSGRRWVKTKRKHVKHGAIASFSKKFEESGTRALETAIRHATKTQSDKRDDPQGRAHNPSKLELAESCHLCREIQNAVKQIEN